MDFKIIHALCSLADFAFLYLNVSPMQKNVFCSWWPLSTSKAVSCCLEIWLLQLNQFPVIFHHTMENSTYFVDAYFTLSMMAFKEVCECWFVKFLFHFFLMSKMIVFIYCISAMSRWLPNLFFPCTALHCTGLVSPGKIYDMHVSNIVDDELLHFSIG